MPDTPAEVNIPPNQSVSSIIKVLTPSLEACKPAVTPLAPPPIIKIDV